MKSTLEFYDAATNQLSRCGEVLDIQFSNQSCAWQGVVLEQGSSPYFYPNQVYTPYFYFALALDKRIVSKDENGSASITFSADEIWINPPFTPFSHHIDEPCHFIILAVEKAVFFQHCPLPIDQQQLQFLTNYNVTDAVLTHIIQLFVLEAKTKGANGELYLQSLLALLAQHYILHYSNYPELGIDAPRNTKFDQRQLAMLDSYIMENMGSSITIDCLAGLFHCSKFYFLREFKRHFAITPYQYLLQKRLTEAKKRLHQPNLNLAKLSSDLGFTDQSHFSRVFKKHLGITPGLYAKQQQPDGTEPVH